jgi:hypothetical protein
LDTSNSSGWEISLEDKVFEAMATGPIFFANELDLRELMKTLNKDWFYHGREQTGSSVQALPKRR